MLYNKNCCKNTEKNILKPATYFVLIVKYNLCTEENIKHKYVVHRKKKSRIDHPRNKI